MTFYFDKFGNELDDVWRQNPDLTGIEKIRALEHRLVRDVSIATEWPGFPADLREAIHRIILRHGVESEGCDNEKVETWADHYREVSYLAARLHDLFHALAQRGLEGFSDDPTVPLRNLVDDAAAYRRTLKGCV